MRLAICIALMASVGHGQWLRYIHAVKSFDRAPDSPPAHPLAFFRADPRARPESDRPCAMLDLCYCPVQPCPPPTRSELEERTRTHTDLRLVGTVGGLSVYELSYFLSGSNGPPDLRSVLVETAPDEIHEIHVQDRSDPFSEIYPSQLVGLEPAQVLKTKYDDGGNYHIVYEDYYTISGRGVHLLDFKPVFEAARKAVPGDMVIYQPTEMFDFNELAWTSETESATRMLSQRSPAAKDAYL